MLNKNVLRNLSYGVYVVGANDNKRPTGCIANCAVQLTYNTVAVSLNHENYTNKIIKETGIFSLSILGENSNPDIISTFGFTSGKDKNKFDNTEFIMKDNVPVIKNSTGYLILKTKETVELETHTLFIAEIIEGDILSEDIPMTYSYYHKVLKGSAPKKAPTYTEPENNPISEGKTFRCKICGYIYKGDISKEGPDFVCPVCKQPISVFEEIKVV